MIVAFKFIKVGLPKIELPGFGGSETNEVTPQETDKSVDIDQFSPNPKKKLKIVFKEEEGNQTIQEVEDNG